ncbi:MAG: topoisomerase subunit [Firmicutes bacterium]|nr:topoisomerase subunit [Bacillota bacterium]
MAKKNNIPKDFNIVKTPLEEAMPDNYLPYAVEVAKDRALPDVRDGMKPVHRRILYGAYMLKAFPDKPYFKSARIVGDILGKYHPHGDTSVYDAMVILAQDFATRKPLIDGHGNWGSQDGDNAAAMRYTEARLTPIALEMLKDIEKGVVDMVDNYSGSELEPSVLPAKYPNLLVNGTFGIAVGLATNIPPHNLVEVIDAELAYIDNNDINTQELMKYIKGPDLPTGGIIIGKNSMLSAYETGEGKVTLRAKTSLEKLENGKPGIVITEFPYRKSKAKLLQTISEMTADKRHAKVLEPISDIRDESDRDGIRAVIEFKKSVDRDTAERVLKYLFKKTDLQSNLSFNMVALAEGKPQTLGLKAILGHYLKHQKEVVTRRTQRELETAQKRFHIVEGFIKAIGLMDEIIKLIRASKSKKDASNNLVEKFGFTELQAEAILELMLYRLTGLEISAFEKEHKELAKLIKKLTKILEDEKELLKVIKTELTEVRDKFGDNRRTMIVEDDEEAKIDIEEIIPFEDVIVTLSNEGFIKRVPLKTYNRSNAEVEDIEHREGDFNRFLLNSNTKDTVMVFTDSGSMYQIRGANIPEQKWKDKGERLDMLIKGLDLNQEKIVGAFSIESTALQKDFIFFTSTGCMKKSGLDKFSTNYTKLMAVKLKDDEKLVAVKLADVEREEAFIKFTTELGMEFTVEEPQLESADRNIASIQLVTTSAENRIRSADFTAEYNYGNFFVNIGKDGMMRTAETRDSKCSFSEACSSGSRLLLFQDNGLVLSIPAYMIQNIGERGMNMSKLFEGVELNRILKVVCVDDFSADKYLYFVSSKGMVKKTALDEFQGDAMTSAAYKFKTEQDSLVGVELGGNADDLLIITRKGMSILFSLDSVNPMGRIASGVTAISLGEDDQVIYEMVAESVQDKAGSLKLTSKKGMDAEIRLADFRRQNRAGKGKNIFLIVFEDFIKDIKYKSR